MKNSILPEQTDGDGEETMTRTFSRDTGSVSGHSNDKHDSDKHGNDRCKRNNNKPDKSRCDAPSSKRLEKRLIILLDLYL